MPEDENKSIPTDFANQCQLVWKNIEKQLSHVDMNLNNIIKITTFLSDRKYRTENSKVRQMVLGDIQPAITVVICGIYEEEWFLEIEVIAAD